MSNVQNQSDMEISGFLTEDKLNYYDTIHSVEKESLEIHALKRAYSPRSLSSSGSDCSMDKSEQVETDIPFKQMFYQNVPDVLNFLDTDHC